MIKMAFLVPIERLRDMVISIYEEYFADLKAPGPDRAVYSLSVYVAPNYRYIPHRAIESDIIIASGLVAAQLRHLRAKTPLVEVPAGCELAAAVASACREHANAPVAILGSHDMASAACCLGALVEADIKFYEQMDNEPEIVRGDLRRIAAEGRKVFVCEPCTRRHAEGAGYACYDVPMQPPAILQAIKTAKFESLNRRREREKSAQLQTLLNFTHDGVVITDASDRITVFNQAAARLLQIPPSRALGCAVGDILPLGNAGHRSRSATTGERRFALNHAWFAFTKAEVAFGEHAGGHVVIFRKAGEPTIIPL